MKSSSSMISWWLLWPRWIRSERQNYNLRFCVVFAVLMVCSLQVLTKSREWVMMVQSSFLENINLWISDVGENVILALSWLILNEFIPWYPNRLVLAKEDSIFNNFSSSIFCYCRWWFSFILFFADLGNFSKWAVNFPSCCC